MKKIVVASDSFKGTYASLEIAELVRSVLDANEYSIDAIGISDGGEGFCRVLTEAMHGQLFSVAVHDPLMRPIVAAYGVVDDTVIVEMAASSGLTLLHPSEYDPWNATTYGTGELIADALKRGYRKLVIGLGGSATSDCGYGMLQALEGMERELEDAQVTVACDVCNPLCGPHGSAAVYARQKGADDALIERLEERTRLFGIELEKRCGRRLMDIPGAGAAGGVGAALLSLPQAEMRHGIDVVLEVQHFDERIADAAAVITGEGCIDTQTLSGKAPYGIALRARRQGIPCIALYGRMELTEKELATAPWTRVVAIEDFRKGGFSQSRFFE